MSSASEKILKMSFNDMMSLIMKGTTAGCDVHKYSTNFYRHKHSANNCKIFCLVSK